MEKYSWVIFTFFGLIAVMWIVRIFQLRDSLARMPEVKPSGSPKNILSGLGRVSVIIPMKNEEKNARECIERLQAQDYPDVEILAINDNSSDWTEEILKSLNVKYINARKTEEGWTGKNFAIHQIAGMATGEWMLFTDADTRHEKSSVSAALAHMQKNGLEFLTLLPRCLCESFFENLVQPLAMGFTGLWFPIRKINDPNSSLYFANGQYLLIKRSLYEKLGKHEAVRGEYLEDFALARKTKELGAPMQCALGKEVYGTRMYDSFDAIWRGWRRIYLHAFRKNAWVLASHAMETLFLSMVPFAAFIFLLFSDFGRLYPALFLLILLTCISIIVLSQRAYKIVEAKPVYAFLHPFAALLISFYLMDAAFIAARKGKTIWR